MEEFPVWRAGVSATVYIVTTACALTNPFIFFFWPISIPVFLVAMWATASSIQTAWRHDKPLAPAQSRVGWSRAGLVVLAASSIAGSVTAVIPSMGYARPDGLYAWSLSWLVAPALCAAILVTSIRALFVTSPRHIAVAAAAGVIAWPLLLAIRTLRQPILDLDNEFVLFRPSVVQLYVVASVVLGGVALALAFIAGRSIDARILPPNAAIRQSVPAT